MKGIIGECNDINELKTATSKLDVASMCDLKINDNGVWKPVNKLKGVYNNTKGQFATTVVPHYNLIQHKEYFDCFGNALKRLNIKFKATVKVSGQRAYVDFDFVDNKLKFDKLNEEFTTGMRLGNSYDKSCGLVISPRYKRLACSNGMILTRTSKTVSIKHHSKIAQEINKLVESRLHKIINETEYLKSYVSASMKDSTEWITACRIFEKMLKMVNQREKVLEKLGIAIVTTKNEKTKKKELSYVLNDNTKKDKKITRWDMYNAITEHLTHGEQITPFIEGLYHTFAEKLLCTPLEKMPKVEKVLTA